MCASSASGMGAVVVNVVMLARLMFYQAIRAPADAGCSYPVVVVLCAVMLARGGADSRGGWNVERLATTGGGVVLSAPLGCALVRG